MPMLPEPSYVSKPMSEVNCSCGFSAKGYDETHLVEMYEEHNCPSISPDPPQHWLTAIFSWQTMWIVLVIGIVLIQIAGKTDLFSRTP